MTVSADTQDAADVADRAAGDLDDATNNQIETGVAPLVGPVSAGIPAATDADNSDNDSDHDDVTGLGRLMSRHGLDSDLSHLLHTGRLAQSVYDDPWFVHDAMNEGHPLTQLAAEQREEWEQHREFYSRAAELCRMAADQLARRIEKGE